MKKKISVKNLIGAIIIGEIMVSIPWFFGVQSDEDAKILLILYPTVMIVLALIVWVQTYFINDVELKEFD